MTMLLSSANENLELVRSVDRGREWLRLGKVPDRIFGVAFFDSLNGFAWGPDFAYRTDDGGETWSGRQVVDLFEAGQPRPVVDWSNRLWVASRKVSGADVGYRLTSFDAELEERSSLTISDRIERMDATESGLWLLVQQGGYGKALVSRLRENDSGRIVPLFELNDDLPLGLAVRGSSIAVALSDASDLGSSRYVLARETLQAVGEWREFTLRPSDSLQLVCVDEGGGLWAIGREWLWHTTVTG